MLEVEQDAGVSVLRLRHGKVNALDLELLHAITEALAAAGEQTAVVITGSGTVFSAGVDLQRVVAGGGPGPPPAAGPHRPPRPRSPPISVNSGTGRGQASGEPAVRVPLKSMITRVTAGLPR